MSASGILNQIVVKKLFEIVFLKNYLKLYF